MTTHSERFTSPADAMAALRSSMREQPGAPEQLFKCGRCRDSGWEELKEDGRGVVARCQRGCDVPRPRSARIPKVKASGGVEFS